LEVRLQSYKEGATEVALPVNIDDKDENMRRIFKILLLLMMITALYSKERVKAPSDLKVIKTTQNSVTIEWKDNSDNEEGFRIYKKKRKYEFKPAAWFEIEQKDPYTIHIKTPSNDDDEPDDGRLRP